MAIKYIIHISGKYQMQVLPQVGHAVHEDNPDKVSLSSCSVKFLFVVVFLFRFVRFRQVANVLAHFLVRNKMATATANFEPVMPSC